MPALPTPILYTLLVLSGLLWAVLGLAYKMADHTQCRTAAFTRVFMVTSSLITLAVSLLLERAPWGDWRLWALGIAFGVLFYGVLLLLMPAYRMGPPSVVWIMVNLGALVPIFLSPLFHEQLFWQLDSVLILLFVATLLVFERGMAQTQETARAGGAAFIGILLALFLANGLLLAGPKLQTLLANALHRPLAFGYLTIFYGTCAVVALLADLAQRQPLAPRRPEWSAGLLAGLSGVLGMLCFMTTMALPAAVTFPVNAGLSLLGGVMLTTILYKERLNTLKLVGLALGLMVVLLFAYRPILQERFIAPAAAAGAQR